VAIKTVLFQNDPSDDQTARLASEAAIARNLVHPNIVSTYSHDIRNVTQSQGNELAIVKFYLVQVPPSPLLLSFHAVPLQFFRRVRHFLCHLLTSRTSKLKALVSIEIIASVAGTASNIIQIDAFVMYAMTCILQHPVTGLRMVGTNHAAALWHLYPSVRPQTAALDVSHLCRSSATEAACDLLFARATSHLTACPAAGT
jgi:hypothetical protein